MRDLLPLLALVASNPNAMARPPRERVVGPVRDLRRELREVVHVLRHDPRQVEAAARYVDQLLEERGLYPGCHVRQPGDPPLEDDEVILEWFAGQLPGIVKAQHLKALVRWLAHGVDLVGEWRPPVPVIRRTPEDAAKLSREDVRKLARAEEKRERRARKRLENEARSAVTVEDLRAAHDRQRDLEAEIEAHLPHRKGES